MKNDEIDITKGEIDLDKLMDLYKDASLSRSGVLIKERSEDLDGIALSGRVSYHMTRLLEEESSEAEKTFSHALMNYFKQQPFNEIFHGKLGEELKKGLEITEGEGAGTAMWWTIAPYLHQTLTKNYNLSNKEAIEVSYKWAATGKFDGALTGSRATMKGLSELRNYGIDADAFFLSDNPKKMTHEAAEGIAKYIAKNVIMEDN